ncbi:MAG: hypothetical protein GXO86_03665 [Chlorobi bacterium]|nr:hypothetical protein [Chlorobiota bacterium]
MRKTILFFLIFSAATVLFAQSSHEWNIKWNKGLQFQRADDQFKIKIGGRFSMTS